MSIARVEQLKKHVRADDFEGDDELLALYLESAEEAILRDIGRSEEELEKSFGKVPAPLRQAVLLLVGYWYDQRETASAAQITEVPFAVRSLTLPYKRLVPLEDEETPENPEEPCEPEE